MDRRHQLDAPDNEELKDIEQVADHSDLSRIYRKAKDQWEGELVTDTERDRRRQHKYDTIAFGVRKRFVAIGFIIPLPLLLAWLIVSTILSMVTEDNAPMFVIPMMFTFMLWGLISYFAYRKVYAIFYNNTLQAGPFVVTLLTLLIASIPLIYDLTASIHAEKLIVTAAIVGAVMILWSILLTLPLLRLWSTPTISANGKLVIIVTLAAVLIGLALFSSLA